MANKLKSLGSGALTEESRRQPSTDPAVWFLVAALMQSYNEKEQLTKEKHNRHRVRERGAVKCNGAKSRAQGDEI